MPRSLLFVLLFTLYACESGSDQQSPLDGVDQSDPTSVQARVTTIDGNVTDPLRARQIPYRVYAPENTSDSVPVVLVSHGGTGSERGFTTGEHIGVALASARFVAVHVGHLPSADIDQHLADRPADVTYLLDRLEASELELPSTFTGEIDLSRVGHVGHSFGAYTSHAVGGATFDRTYTDARVIAIAPISPQGSGQFKAFDRGPDDNTWASVDIPAYNLVGSEEIDGNDIGTVDVAGWRLMPFERYGRQSDRILSILDDQGHRDMWNQGSESVRQWIAEQLVTFFTVYVAGEQQDRACSIGRTANSDVGVVTERKTALSMSRLLDCR